MARPRAEDDEAVEYPDPNETEPNAPDSAVDDQLTADDFED